MWRRLSPKSEVTTPFCKPVEAGQDALAPASFFCPRAINSSYTASQGGVFYYFHEIQLCREVANGLELFSKGENFPVLWPALRDHAFLA